ncbi:MAG: hypothetical protein NT169_09725 [Chloroflexi bacterium]|nr:hypothetical protein [Chloroflexota bacterium]
MQVSTNEKLIKRRGRLGTYAALGGVAVLIVGMIASMQQQYMWISLIAIVLGFLLAQLGNYNLRRYSRTPRPDQVLETAFKGFDDRYHYYAWSLPVPYALLTPHGIFTFTPRDQTGAISVNGARWNSKLTLSRVLTIFAQEGLGNPTSEASETATRLTTWIKAKLPDVAANVQPVIVFIDDRAKLQITEPTVPVLDPKGLKKWVRVTGRGEHLKSADYRALEELFNANVAAISK